MEDDIIGAKCRQPVIACAIAMRTIKCALELPGIVDIGEFSGCLIKRKSGVYHRGIIGCECWIEKRTLHPAMRDASILKRRPDGLIGLNGMFQPVCPRKASPRFGEGTDCQSIPVGQCLVVTARSNARLAMRQQLRLAASTSGGGVGVSAAA